MNYVLYEGGNGDMLFTKVESVKSNPEILAPFENKTPTFTVEAEDDGAAVAKLNSFILARGQK